MSNEKLDWQRYPELEPSLIQDMRGRIRGIADPQKRLEMAVGMQEALEQEVIFAIQASGSNQEFDRPVDRDRDLRIKPE